MLANTIFLA
uniref:Uncharacterized protein n=1 Tax=Arundo donax TaxID=35708 RepID=A0A0A9ENM2_ARUDO